MTVETMQSNQEWQRVHHTSGALWVLWPGASLQTMSDIAEPGFDIAPTSMFVGSACKNGQGETAAQA